MALDFPNNPANNEIWPGTPPSTATWRYAQAENAWSIVPAGVAGAGGFAFLREIPDLSALPTYIEQELASGVDYEFDIANARGVPRNSVLSIQFSADAGATWESSPGGLEFATQRVGANSSVNLNKTASDDAPGFGRLGDRQDQNYTEQRAPGRHHFYIQTHDLADTQTQAIGTYNSYGDTGSPFMQAMFTTRQALASRIDNRVRIFYAVDDSSIAARDFLQGVCRIYTRVRG